MKKIKQKCQVKERLLRIEAYGAPSYEKVHEVLFNAGKKDIVAALGDSLMNLSNDELGNSIHEAYAYVDEDGTITKYTAVIDFEGRAFNSRLFLKMLKEGIENGGSSENVRYASSN